MAGISSYKPQWPRRSRGIPWLCPASPHRGSQSTVTYPVSCSQENPRHKIPFPQTTLVPVHHNSRYVAPDRIDPLRDTQPSTGPSRMMTMVNNRLALTMIRYGITKPQNQDTVRFTAYVHGKTCKLGTILKKYPTNPTPTTPPPNAVNFHSTATPER